MPPLRYQAFVQLSNEKLQLNLPPKHLSLLELSTLISPIAQKLPLQSRPRTSFAKFTEMRKTDLAGRSTDRTIDERKYINTFLSWDIQSLGFTTLFVPSYQEWSLGTWTDCESMLFEVPDLLYWSAIAHSNCEDPSNRVVLTQKGNFPRSGSLQLYFAELHEALTMFHEATRSVYARKEAMKGFLRFGNLDDYINRALQREAMISIDMELILFLAYEKVVGLEDRSSNAASPIRFLEDEYKLGQNTQVVEFLKEVRQLIAGEGQFNSWAGDLYDYVDVVWRLMEDIDKELESAGVQVT